MARRVIPIERAGAAADNEDDRKRRERAMDELYKRAAEEEANTPRLFSGLTDVLMGAAQKQRPDIS